MYNGRCHGLITRVRAFVPQLDTLTLSLKATLAKRVLHSIQAAQVAQLHWISRVLFNKRLYGGSTYGLLRWRLMLVSGIPILLLPINRLDSSNPSSTVVHLFHSSLFDDPSSLGWEGALTSRPLVCIRQSKSGVSRHLGESIRTSPISLPWSVRADDHGMVCRRPQLRNVNVIPATTAAATGGGRRVSPWMLVCVLDKRMRLTKEFCAFDFARPKLGTIPLQAALQDIYE